MTFVELLLPRRTLEFDLSGIEAPGHVTIDIRTPVELRRLFPRLCLSRREEQDSVLLFCTPAESCWRYSSGTNSSNMKSARGCMWVCAAGNSGSRSLIALAELGGDLNSTRGGRKIISAAVAQTTINAHQCPITFLVDIFSLSVHPSTPVNEITEHINDCFCL